MNILMFGATGQVAREILARAPEVRALSRDEADLSDPQGCADIIQRTDADLIINAAAYTAVDQAEQEEPLATLINGEAPGAMARAAAARGIPFLHISTDYVFDGSGEQPRKPDAPTAPLSAYGRSKLVGEKAIQAAGGDYVILRVSWVFSSHGRNFVKTMLRLGAERDSLTIVDDQHGGPTSAGAIAAALLEIGRQMVDGRGCGAVYHFAGLPTVTWAGHAREIFDQAGLGCAVVPIPTSGYPTPARRPQNSRLDCTELTSVFGIRQPDWRADLAEVLEELQNA